MNKKRLYSMCGVLILTCGLVSCSKDKDKVVLVPDNLKADGFTPQGVNPNSNGVEFDSVKLVDISGALTLTSLANKDFSQDPVDFDLNSKCTDVLTSLAYQKNFHQKNSTVFQVLSLIPEDLLILPQQTQVKCDFVVTAKNGRGSTSSAELKDIAVSGVSSFSNLNLEFIKDGESVYERDLASPIALRGSKTQVQIKCTDFGASNTANADHVTLDSLVANGIAQDPKVAVQNCRILSTNEETIQISAPFKLKMPMQAVRVYTEVPPLETFGGPLKTITALRVKLYNPNSFPVTFTIQNKDASQYLFQPLYLGGPFKTLLAPMISRTLHWQTAAVLNYAEQNMNITLEAFSETVVEGVVDLNINCDNVVHAPRVVSGYFIGKAFTFDFSQTTFSISPYEGLRTDLTLNFIEASVPAPQMTPLVFWDIQPEKVTLPKAWGNLNFSVDYKLQLIKNIQTNNAPACDEL